MPMLLRGITHVIITTAPSKAIAEKTKVWASAELCLGPGDSNCIAQIEYVQNKNGTMGWRLPNVTVERDGKKVMLPVFTGALVEELTQWAARALELVKKKYVRVGTGRIYRVSRAGAEEVSKEVGRQEEATAVAATA